MLNENPNSESENQGLKPHQEQPLGKLKHYGTKAYAPLVKVVHKYQDEITPYFSALAKGLQGGAQVLAHDSASGPEKMVASWFKEASAGLEEARSKITAGDVNEIMNFVEEQARKQPSLMFSASYISGLFFGRIGKYIGKKGTGQEQQNDNTNYGEETLH